MYMEKNLLSVPHHFLPEVHPFWMDIVLHLNFLSNIQVLLNIKKIIRTGWILILISPPPHYPCVKIESTKYINR